jgi:hypothetical protein
MSTQRYLTKSFHPTTARLNIKEEDPKRSTTKDLNNRQVPRKRTSKSC